MKTSGHLWAIGYGDMKRAAEVRDEIVKLGWAKHDLILEDVAVVVRHPDGSFKVDRAPVPSSANVVGFTLVGVLAGLVLGQPMVGAIVGTALGLGGAAVSATVGIGDDFVREVEGLMQPGTSVLFVLDSEGDMDVILHSIRGLGGTVLKTNVDVERARLIQSALAAAPPSGTGERASASPW
jgi:uncharacterized membrane protein